MAIKFEISEILNQFELADRDKKNLAQLFEFTKYLYDNEENLTKTFILHLDLAQDLLKIMDFFLLQFLLYCIC